MALVDLWREHPQQLRDKRVDQIIHFAGDGTLTDSSATHLEFRDFLSRVPLDLLRDYALQCLNTPFKDAGFALQDIANEMGVRLGFQVQWGRYRGVRNQVGFDGLWHTKDRHGIVVEVRTTDVYRLSLSTLAGYRKKLIHGGLLSEHKSSILIVVGREETGELEAQIRGSPHAWDMRLISVEALIRLMEIRNGLDNPALEFRISSLLVPREYTRLDGIIDLVFSTSEEMSWDNSNEFLFFDLDAVETMEVVSRKPNGGPHSLTQKCLHQLEFYFGVHLTQFSKVSFKDIDSNLLVCLWVTKGRSRVAGGFSFSFKLHNHNLVQMAQGPVAYGCFGCGFSTQMAIVPVDFIMNHINVLEQVTDPLEGDYWKIYIHQSKKVWSIFNPTSGVFLDITSFMFITGPNETGLEPA